MIDTMHDFVTKNDDGGNYARFSYLTRAMIEELSAELAERDEETLQAFMEQIGEVIAWIGHGDIQRLPDDMRLFAEKRLELEQAAT